MYARGGIQDDRPDRGDEDQEDRRGLRLLKNGKADRQPCQRRHRPQHLKQGIERPEGKYALPDQNAQRHADDRGQAVTDQHAAKAGQHMSGNADIAAVLNAEMG